MKTHVICMPTDDVEKVGSYITGQGFEPKIWGAFDNKYEWKLETPYLYEEDHPGSGFRISGSVIGCTLGHWTLWKALDYFADEEYYHVMEADIHFVDGWRERFEQALKDVPDDWDMLYPGSCCAEGTGECVKGEVYAGKPMCTHWYMVKHKALKTLIQTNQQAWAPIDVQLILKTHPKLKVYCILPRLADQYNTEILP